MFRNYLVTALRNIIRHKLYSFINIAGLAVGLACVIFVLLFIRDELSYDKWIPDTQNLYRIEKIIHPPGFASFEVAQVPFVMPAVMRDNLPEVAAMTRINAYSMSIMAGDRQFRESVSAVDPNFFQIIKLPLAKGDPAAVFRDPESVVLSESAARKYFGTVDAVGKVIKTTANCEIDEHMDACLSRWVPLKVTGILRDIPHNSHLVGDMFFPNTSIIERLSKEARTSWAANRSYGYVVLAPGARPQSVIAKMGPLLDRNVTDAGSVKGSQLYSIHLTPFTDVHLSSGRWKGNEKAAGSWTTLYGVGIVGLLIMFIACFNFMNLATARALLRAREIALRKTHGARRAQLIAQFLGEAVLMALISLVLALALVELLQPAFGHFLQHPVLLHYASDWPLLLGIVGIAVVAGLISGSYPALVLSGFRPVVALRAGPAGSGRLRTVLVVLQFAVSIALGIAATVVFSQISYARNIDLGFRRDNVLVVIGNALLTMDGEQSFVQRLRANPDILDVAMIDVPPFSGSTSMSSTQLAGRPEKVLLSRRVIGTNTVQFLGMKLVAGRLLSDKRAQDEVNVHSPADVRLPGNDGHNILVDKAAASRFGLTPERAIGHVFILQKTRLNIVGVLADAKFDGAREPAGGSIFFNDPKSPAAQVMMRIRPDAVPQTVAFVDREWQAFAPTKAVWRYFLDDNFGKLYQADERQGDLFGVFVTVAIFISCLGLFGLAAFTAGRRTREIGIRKAFGARTRDVTLLLLWQFSIPVLVANAIAWPLAWYYLHGWLQGFAYHIPLSPLYFLAGGTVAMLIAWLTVFTHALRVARANPVHALRYE